MYTEQPVEYVKKTEPYKTYNYAILHSLGLCHVFDTMRYDNAFLVRESDLKILLEAAEDYIQWISRRFTLLLCKYDWYGPKKAGWTPARLLNDQEYEYIEDMGRLFVLTPDRVHDMAFTAKPPLKFEGIATITGLLPMILHAMFDNKACPDEEGDAHKIEQAFYAPKEPVVVKLRNYAATEQKWLLPPT